MENKELNEFLKIELERFAAQLVNDYAAELRSRGRDVTGTLLKSFEYEVRAQAFRAGADILELGISFDDAGRYLDIKKLGHDGAEGGRDYIANLISWIDRSGLTNKLTRGYVRKRKLKKEPERVLTYIAFGIARKRFNGKYRRTRYYNRRKTAGLNELLDDVLAGLPEVVSDQLGKNFADEQGISNGTRLTSTKTKGKTTLNVRPYNRDKTR